MTDPALAAMAERTAVFARMSPSQKTRVIQALRSRGHVVGYIGDGINDAPALRGADVGLSVPNAVDVAREAADVILLEKRLEVLHEGVLEGRRSFGNIMKYVLMGTSSNFGNMVSMALASLVLPFLPMLPLQILLNNFLYDVSQVAIPSDRVDGTYMREPRRWDVKFIRRYMLVLGPVSSAFDLLTFAVLLGVFRAGPELFHTGWFVESLATQALVIFVIRTAGRPWASAPSRGLVLTVASALGVGVLLPFTPAAPWLGFTPLPPLLCAVLAGMTLAYLALVEVVKTWFYRRDVA
jgi:Mg2+-importing ATPase